MVIPFVGPLRRGAIQQALDRIAESRRMMMPGRHSPRLSNSVGPTGRRGGAE
jgi:hypothetical protein